MNESEREQRRAETQAQDREAESIRLKAALRQKDEAEAILPWVADLENAAHAMCTNLQLVDSEVDGLEHSIEALECAMGICPEASAEPPGRSGPGPGPEADLPRILEAVRQHGLDLGAEMQRLRALSDRLRAFRMRLLGEEDQPQLQREEAEGPPHSTCAVRPRGEDLSRDQD